MDKKMGNGMHTGITKGQIGWILKILPGPKYLTA